MYIRKASKVILIGQCVQNEKREKGLIYLLCLSSTQCIESLINPTAHLVWGAIQKCECQLKLLNEVLANRSAVAS